LGTRTISDVCPDSEVGFLVMKTWQPLIASCYSNWKSWNQVCLWCHGNGGRPAEWANRWLPCKCEHVSPAVRLFWFGNVTLFTGWPLQHSWTCFLLWMPRMS
jgi:hypothetical protein